MAERTGLVGVGIVGRPMVKNLVDAGYPVTIFDIEEDPRDEVRH